MNGADVQVQQVTFSYGRAEEVLHGVDLEVRAGEAVALTGASGSGKSTLLHCIAGLQVPSGGSIRVGDIPVSELSAVERSRFRLHHCGMVLQFGYLVPDLPLVDNVALPLRLAGVDWTEARAAALSLMDLLGVACLSRRLPSEVSGGQMQRAAVARALVTEPEVLLADEPTGSLDSSNRLAIMHALTTTARTLGTTVLVATHDITSLHLFDRAVTVVDGVVTGPTAVGAGR